MPPLIQCLLLAAGVGQVAPPPLLFSQAQRCVCQGGCRGEGCSCFFETDLEVESFFFLKPYLEALKLNVYNTIKYKIKSFI